MLFPFQAFPAGVHRLPEHVSTGLALMIGSREADLTQIPGAALGVPRSSLTGATGGHVVERVGSDVTASFIHLGRELGGEAAQDFTERLERLRSVGLRHAQQFGGVCEQAIAKNLQGFARVRS